MCPFTVFAAHSSVPLHGLLSRHEFGEIVHE
jgi:hypothetical protein